MRNHRLRSKQSEIEILGPQIASYAVNNNDFAFNSPGRDVTVYYPSGIQVGDLLVLIIRPGGSATISTPSGWTLLTSYSNDGVSYVFTRVADSALSGSFTVYVSTSHAAGCVMLRITDYTDSSVAFSSGTNSLDPPSLTTAFSPSDIDKLFIAVTTYRYTTHSISGLPSGYSDLISCEGTSACNTTQTTVSVAKKSTDVVTDDPSAFTTSGSCQANAPHSITLAIS
jgi:hypothetical protein